MRFGVGDRYDDGGGGDHGVGDGDGTVFGAVLGGVGVVACADVGRALLCGRLFSDGPGALLFKLVVAS